MKSTDSMASIAAEGTVEPGAVEPGAARGSLAPVIKEVRVPLSPERAFALFTTEVGGWWPLKTHSVEGDAAAGCAFEERVGGRLYEYTADGTQHTWGTLLGWDPPRGFAMSWHPGRAPDTAQRLEVAFVGDSDGTTVTLVHTGWERLGTDARRERHDYDSGWDYVLGFFTEAVA